MIDDPKIAMLIYRSQMHATLKCNEQLLPAFNWLRLLLNHVPGEYKHSVRYLGLLSLSMPACRKRPVTTPPQPVEAVFPSRRCPQRRTAATLALTMLRGRDKSSYPFSGYAIGGFHFQQNRPIIDIESLVRIGDVGRLDGPLSQAPRHECCA